MTLPVHGLLALTPDSNWGPAANMPDLPACLTSWYRAPESRGLPQTLLGSPAHRLVVQPVIGGEGPLQHQQRPRHSRAPEALRRREQVRCHHIIQ